MGTLDGQARAMHRGYTRGPYVPTLPPINDWFRPGKNIMSKQEKGFERRGKDEVDPQLRARMYREISFPGVFSSSPTSDVALNIQIAFSSFSVRVASPHECRRETLRGFMKLNRERIFSPLETNLC